MAATVTLRHERTGVCVEAPIVGGAVAAEALQALSRAVRAHDDAAAAAAAAAAAGAGAAAGAAGGAATAGATAGAAATTTEEDATQETSAQQRRPRKTTHVSARPRQPHADAFAIYDVGYTNTAVCRSAISFIDSDRGILRCAPSQRRCCVGRAARGMGRAASADRG